MVYGLDTKDALAYFTIDPNTGIATPISTTADGQAAAAAPVASSRAHLFNGIAWDRQRGNTEGTLLASAPRTAGAASPTQTNHNARGALCFLNVTAASGIGGLTLRFQGVDPVTVSGQQISATPTAVTTTGLYVYEIYPGDGSATGGVTQRTNGLLPRSWGISVNAGDASSYTYSVGYSLIV